MKVCISGPITGNPRYLDDFKAAATGLYEIQEAL